jgi:hypothetical protein
MPGATIFNLALEELKSRFQNISEDLGRAFA